jgi:hypothetical protein
MEKLAEHLDLFETRCIQDECFWACVKSNDPLHPDQRSKIKVFPLLSYSFLLAPDSETSSTVALLMHPGNWEV